MTLDNQARRPTIALYERILQQQHGMTFTTTNESVTTARLEHEFTTPSDC